MMQTFEYRGVEERRSWAWIPRKCCIACVVISTYIVGCASGFGFLRWYYAPVFTKTRKMLEVFMEDQMAKTNAADGHLLRRNAELIKEVQKLSARLEKAGLHGTDIEDINFGLKSNTGDTSPNTEYQTLQLAKAAENSLHRAVESQKLALAQCRDVRSSVEDQVIRMTDELAIAKENIKRCTGKTSKAALHTLDVPSRRAFVTLAHDDAGSQKYLLRALALAHMIQELSRYPLVLLTNASHWQDGTPIEPGFRELGVELVRVHAVTVGQKFLPVKDWKLQAWGLTGYSKLVWLDSDSVVYRSLDWLFDREGMWAQGMDNNCKHHGDGPIFSPALLLLYPKPNDYQGMLEAAVDMSENLNSQSIIYKYFLMNNARPINLLSPIEASFGQCLTKVSSPYVNSDGTLVDGYWNMPAFVHQSGGWGNANSDYQNVCFSYEIARQRYDVGNSILNVCQYNPLANYWRRSFCDSVYLGGIHLPSEIAQFCDNSCYHFGQGAHCAGQVNATLSYQEYYSRMKGLPEPEIRG